MHDARQWLLFHWLALMPLLMSLMYCKMFIFSDLHSVHLWYASIVYCKHHHFHWIKFRPLSMSFAHYIYFHSPDKRTPLLMWWQTLSFPMTTVDVIGALQYTIISIIWGEHRKISTPMWLFYLKALILERWQLGIHLMYEDNHILCMLKHCQYIWISHYDALHKLLNSLIISCLLIIWFVSFVGDKIIYGI
jgi:hypothetical protein